MTFADNHLTLSHAASGLSFSFGAMDSLEKVKAGQGWEDEGGGVKVKYAEEWGKTRYVEEVISAICAFFLPFVC
jgi:hypothetical protein